jgi:hypothetical protein
MSMPSALRVAHGPDHLNRVRADFKQHVKVMGHRGDGLGNGGLIACCNR